jgi:hypothetical protein
MRHIESEKATGELITGLCILDNPNVHSEELQVRLVTPKKAGDKKVDMRVWIDSILGSNGKYAGPTKKGFRLTLEQYRQFRNEVIPLIDEKVKAVMLADETDNEGDV